MLGPLYRGQEAATSANARTSPFQGRDVHRYLPPATAVEALQRGSVGPGSRWSWPGASRGLRRVV